MSNFVKTQATLDSIKRSTFNLSHSRKTTFNVGDIIPLEQIEVLPGDTFKMGMAMVSRLQTQMRATMDNLFFEYMAFFVPNRLVYDEWQNLMGESKTAWQQDEVYEAPHIRFNLSGEIVEDYLGPHAGALDTLFSRLVVPLNSTGTWNEVINPQQEISLLTLRGYDLIYNDWFRDQNLIDPLLIDKSGGLRTIEQSQFFNISNQLRGMHKASKKRDYFTTALPAPQKGPAVYMPLSDTFSFPVVSKAEAHGGAGTNPAGVSVDVTLTGGQVANIRTKADGQLEAAPAQTGSGGSGDLYFTNLWAEAEKGLSPTMNAFRTAMQIQRIYEKDARGGTRYIEMIKAHFNVNSPDSRLQRPEYLGGGVFDYQINQVVNQSEDLGDTGAFGYASGKNFTFKQSFTEHGYIHIVGVARYKHTYSQGIPRHLLRKERFDYYLPTLAHLGEQPIFTSELYAAASPSKVFGYKEAWSEMRYLPNTLDGYFAPAVDQSIAVWHYGDHYLSEPTLSKAWIEEDKANVDRTLAVTSSVTHQILFDAYFNIKATRIMPTYSIPGMVDHY